MKRNLLLVFLIAVFGVGCSTQSGSPSEFPLEKGTTWVYSFETYEPSEPSPSQIVEATYRLTATVAETEIKPPYFLAHVIFKYELVSSDSGWRGLWVNDRPTETWYILDNHQIFESANIDINTIDNKPGTLDYVFPLSDQKRWCHMQNPPCLSVGWRAVINQGVYETPAGKFDECYDMQDFYNGGSRFHTFCIGVGIVAMSYDHVGTPFGYQQTLTEYVVGVP